MGRRVSKSIKLLKYIIISYFTILVYSLACPMLNCFKLLKSYEIFLNKYVIQWCGMYISRVSVACCYSVVNVMPVMCISVLYLYLYIVMGPN